MEEVDENSTSNHLDNRWTNKFVLNFIIIADIN